MTVNAFLAPQTSILTYKGEYKCFPDVHNIGDIIICNGIKYVWSGYEWVDIGYCSCADYHKYNTYTPKIVYKTCDSCGAPISSNGVCEYCGRIYY